MSIFNRNKVQTVGTVSEFLNGAYKERQTMQKAVGLWGLGGSYLVLHATSAEASWAGDKIKSKIMEAFDPFIDLLQGLSYPVAFIFLTGGMLLIMTGQTSRGIGMMKWAAIGFVGMQFIPTLMSILVEIGSAMKG
jgi:hypothetical protein